jgi:hypothetical protein
LRDAVDAQHLPHDFWLLNPTAATDRQLIAKASSRAPSHSRCWRRCAELAEAPLYPGDFLFIWHGSGDFDHMLVVSRRET